MDTDKDRPTDDQEVDEAVDKIIEILKPFGPCLQGEILGAVCLNLGIAVWDVFTDHECEQ